MELGPALPPKPLTDSDGKLPRSLLDRSPLTVSFRHIKPNWRNYMLFVDLAARNGNAAMARYRDCYQALSPTDKLNHWPEQLCDLANVPPGELVGAVCRAIWENQSAESSMISSIAQPELLTATLRLAKKPEHFRDRELLFRSMGMLPDKKGASINIYNQATSNEVNLPDLGAARSSKLRGFDEEIIEMSKELEPASPPFLVKEESDEQGLD